jgi:dynein heavy chain
VAFDPSQIVILTYLALFVLYLLSWLVCLAQYIGNLELLVQGYNKLKQTLLEVEYPLIEDELGAIDEQLRVAATWLTWQDDFWVYMERVQVATAELECRVSQTQSNMLTIQQTMQAWAEWPLLPRRETRREAALTLDDKGDLFAKKYKLIREDGCKIHNLVEVMASNISMSIGCFI